MVLRHRLVMLGDVCEFSFLYISCLLIGIIVCTSAFLAVVINKFSKAIVLLFYLAWTFVP